MSTIPPGGEPPIFSEPPRCELAIRLTTLGPFSIHRDGVEEPAFLSWKRRLGLLVYLGVEGEATRDQLMGILWPEKDPDRARHALSQTLYEIRQVCGSACFQTHGERVKLSSGFQVDAAQFQTLCSEGDRSEALALYGGPFLSGTGLVQTPEFEHWVERTQGRLRRLHRLCRKQELEALQGSGDLKEALAVARRWVELEPLDDEAQHEFIRLLAMTGRRSEAIRHFEAFQSTLAKDDLEPLEETLALVEDIRGGGAVGTLSAPVGAEADPEMANKRASEVPGEVPAPPARPPEQGNWLFEAADVLKEHWVFRVAISYAAGLFVWIQLAEGVSYLFETPDVLLRQITHVGLALFPIVLLGTWALEPVLRRSRHATTSARPGRGRFALVNRKRLATLLVGSVASIWMGILFFPGARTTEDPAPPVSDANADGYALAVLITEEGTSTSPGAEGLSVGLSRNLIRELNDIPDLEVRSYDAVRPYRGSETPLDSVARALDADFFVGGSILQSAGQVALQLEFIDAHSFSVLDASELRRPRGETLALMDDLRDAVEFFFLRALGREISLRNLRTETESQEAWDRVLSAMNWVEDAQEAASVSDSSGARILFARAKASLEEAARLDPEWTEPLVQLGELAEDRNLAQIEATDRPFPEDSARTILAEGEAYLDRALELQEGLAEALEVRGGIRLMEARFLPHDPSDYHRLLDAAEADLNRALSSDPGRAESLKRLASLHLLRGNYEQVRRFARQAYQADRFLDGMRDNLQRLALSSFELGDEEEAYDWCKVGAERFPESPMFVDCKLQILAFGTVIPPDPDLGWALVAEIGQSQRGDAASMVPKAHLMVASILARAQQPDSAQAIMDRIRTDPTLPQPPLWYDAAVLARMGDRAKAVELLAEYLGENPIPGREVARKRVMHPLRGFPPYERLLASEVPSDLTG